MKQNHRAHTASTLSPISFPEFDSWNTLPSGGRNILHCSTYS